MDKSQPSTKNSNGIKLRKFYNPKIKISYLPIAKIIAAGAPSQWIRAVIFEIKNYFWRWNIIDIGMTHAWEHYILSGEH